MSALVAIVGLSRDQGSVVVFEAVGQGGEQWLIAVDHRPAQDIVEALNADNDDDVEAEIEPWQILGRWS